MVVTLHLRLRGSTPNDTQRTLKLLQQRQSSTRNRRTLVKCDSVNSYETTGRKSAVRALKVL